MLIDSTGLGYTIRGGEILVHYPARLADETRDKGGVPGTVRRYEAGWPIGSIPATYASAPPNAITAERVRLWTELQETGSSAQG
jgi:hypothetical protein